MSLIMATHDRVLAIAAQAHGLVPLDVRSSRDLKTISLERNSGSKSLAVVAYALWAKTKL